MKYISDMFAQLAAAVVELAVVTEKINKIIKIS